MTTGASERALASPPDELGPALLALPEDQWFDRKSARIKARDLADVLIGFGNADGGTVVVGLWSGVVEGTARDGRLLNAQMQASVDFSVPPVRARSRVLPCLRADGVADALLVIEVEPGDVVHANQRDEAFLRVGDENRRLTFAQRQELTFDKGPGSFEARPIANASSSELDVRLVDQYAVALGATDSERMLEARGLAVGGQPTVAGLLLFGRLPQKTLPEAYVRVVRYLGRDRGAGARQQLVTDERLEGALPDQILAARRVVAEVQPRRRALQDGVFAGMALVPEDAWLEAVVNAVVHRSYSLAGDHIRIEVFDDRIEVLSPGRFPGIVALSRPADAPRYARNPRIARVCADLNFGQELGEGIRRMYEEMRLAGLADPVYTQGGAAVRVVLSGEPVDRRLDELLPRETRDVVAALRSSERLSTIEVAQRIGVSRPAAIRRLKLLREAGVVEWVGKSPKDPRAYWRVAGR